MRRPFIIIVALVLCAVGCAAAATASTRAPKPTLQVLHTHRYGDILVDSAGYVVYGFSPDSKKRDTCAAVSRCLTIWPAVRAPRTLRLGKGVKRSLVGSIRLANGTRQLTYNGWPLYTYISDPRPHQGTGINICQFSGYWPAVSTRGTFVPKPAASTC